MSSITVNAKTIAAYHARAQEAREAREFAASMERGMDSTHYAMLAVLKFACDNRVSIACGIFAALGGFVAACVFGVI